MDKLIRELEQRALPDPFDEREVLHADVFKRAAEGLKQQQAEMDSHQRTVKEEYGKREALEAAIDSHKKVIKSQGKAINAYCKKIGKLKKIIEEESDMNMASEVYEMNLEEENERLLAVIDTKNGIIQLHQTIEAKLKAEIDKLQAKIDRIMLEYCPDEMTREQLDKWGECQKPVDKHKGE